VGGGGGGVVFLGRPPPAAGPQKIGAGAGAAATRAVKFSDFAHLFQMFVSN